MRHLFKSLVRNSGFEINPLPNPVAGDRAVFEALLKQVRRYSMLPEARLFSLYEQVTYCEEANIAGAFVECGVWKGGAAALMAGASKRRRLHLFDSFTDICEPSEVDGPKAIQEMGGKSTGKLAPVLGAYDGIGGHGTVAECLEVLEAVGYDPSLVHFHVGWFQDTLPTVEIGPIAILRLDGDWYESTKVCLDYLFDSVIPGGFIVIDDYYAYDGCKMAVDTFLNDLQIDVFIQRIDQTAVFFIKRMVESPKRATRVAAA